MSDLVDLFDSILFAHSQQKQSPPAWLLNKIYLYTWPENIDSLVNLISSICHQLGSDCSSWNEFQTQKILERFIFSEKNSFSKVKERSSIEATLKIFDGDREKTALFLKLDRQSLLEKMLHYKIRY